MNPTTSSSLDSVTWGAPSFWIERFPLYCGQAFGFFEEQGIELDIRYTNGGPELADAVTKGQIHVGEMGLPPFVKAHSHGLKARIIGSSVVQQLDHYIAARSGLNRVEDLVGGRVGILSHGSCDDYFIRHILDAHGISPEDAPELVPMGTDYGKVNVISRSLVDAAFMVEPALSAGEEQGAFKAIARVGDYFSRYQWGIILASDEWLGDRLPLVQRLMAAFRKACRYISEHPEDVLALGADVFNVTVDVFRKALMRDLCRWEIEAHLDMVGLENALRVLGDAGIDTTRIDQAEMVHPI